MNSDMCSHENSPVQDSLSRQIGPWSATIIVIASMVGTGIFTTSGLVMQELGSAPALLLCWVVGGLFALSGSLCYGELGAMYPAAGGEYVFLRESFGKCAAFLSGWVSLIVGFSAPIAAAAIAFAHYGLQAVPSGLSAHVAGFHISMPLVSISGYACCALALIAALAVVHSCSLRIGSRVQNTLTATAVIALVLFVIAGLCFGEGSVSSLSNMPRPMLLFSGEFAVAVVFVLFAYAGWNAAAYLGGEIVNPHINIPRALFAGTLTVTVLYAAVNIAYVYALSPEQMSGVIEVGACAVRELFGSGAERLFSLLVAVCLVSVASAMMIQGPRVYYAMARDGSFFAIFGRVSPRHRTPVLAVMLQGALAGVMTITAAFEDLLIYIGFTLSLFTMLSVAGLMVLRMRKPDVPRPYRTAGYPVTPLFFIGVSLWVVLFCLLKRPLAPFWGFVTIAAGSVFYMVKSRRLK